jgi:hypothetical protein
MYLTKINIKNGLLDLEKSEDGILAIKEFREVLMDEDLRFEDNIEYPGHHCLTAIALVVDYQSPKRYYSEEDRPKASMEEVTGKRNAFPWHTERVQLALRKYDELQYDPIVEEGKIYYESKVRKLREYREAEQYYGKKHNQKDADGEEKIFKNPVTIRADIRKINDDIKEYEKQIQGKDIYGNSPVVQGYTLSRLEQKVMKKNSFYKEKR